MQVIQLYFIYCTTAVRCGCVFTETATTATTRRANNKNSRVSSFSNNNKNL